jgi:hypothetical protein
LLRAGGEKRTKDIKKGNKKIKKIGKEGIFSKNFGNGADGDIANLDIIRLMCFWRKNEGKNEHFFALF